MVTMAGSVAQSRSAGEGGGSGRAAKILAIKLPHFKSPAAE